MASKADSGHCSFTGWRGSRRLKLSGCMRGHVENVCSAVQASYAPNQFDQAARKCRDVRGLPKPKGGRCNGLDPYESQ